MIKVAKKRGFVTIDELNGVLPDGEVSSDQIEDIYAMLNDMGINVIETDEAEEARRARRRGGAGGRRARRAGADRGRQAGRASRPTAPTIRSACICARWARSSSSRREGEIAIAKRIEAGRETMIAGLCESPLTFQAIIIWRDELNAGKILLRDIIDLEATYAGPDAKNAVPPPPRRRRRGRQRCRRRRRQAGQPAQGPGGQPQPGARPGAAAAAPGGAAARSADGEEVDEVEAERARLAAGGGRRGRLRERPVARRDGGRAQAEGGRDLRQRRRPLQEAPPPAGPGRRVQAEERDALALARSAATRS